MLTTCRALGKELYVLRLPGSSRQPMKLGPHSPVSRGPGTVRAPKELASESRREGFACQRQEGDSGFSPFAEKETRPRENQGPLEGTGGPGSPYRMASIHWSRSSGLEAEIRYDSCLPSTTLPSPSVLHALIFWPRQLGL